jgi:hypothetical protein
MAISARAARNCPDVIMLAALIISVRAAIIKHEYALFFFKHQFLYLKYQNYWAWPRDRNLVHNGRGEQNVL